MFPNLWKKANVVPIHEKGEKNLIKKYCSVSLLLIFRKIFKILIFNSYFKYIDQVFTNCMHSYDHAHNMHVIGIDWEHNWELLIACPKRPLCFKKIRTTTTTGFLISNTVVPNPYSHSTTFDLKFFAPLHPYLKFQVRLIDLPQSDIQIFYGLQTDNSIWQCVNSNWTRIF